MALDPKNRLRKLESVIRKHPILTRLTGLTIAGLIFIIYIAAPIMEIRKIESYYSHDHKYWKCLINSTGPDKAVDLRVTAMGEYKP